MTKICSNISGMIALLNLVFYQWYRFSSGQCMMVELFFNKISTLKHMTQTSFNCSD